MHRFLTALTGRPWLVFTAVLAISAAFFIGVAGNTVTDLFVKLPDLITSSNFILDVVRLGEKPAQRSIHVLWQ